MAFRSFWPIYRLSIGGLGQSIGRVSIVGSGGGESTYSLQFNKVTWHTSLPRYLTLNVSLDDISLRKCATLVRLHRSRLDIDLIDITVPDTFDANARFSLSVRRKQHASSSHTHASRREYSSRANMSASCQPRCMR